MNNKFKSGFCALVGMPNVGKSTLLNTIAGQKIAIISDKPQTTRNEIRAVYSTDEEQIIFVDTPGIHNPRSKLGEFMVRTANAAMRDTDVVVFVVDATKGIRKKEREIAESISKLDIPRILVINKIDLIKKEALLPMIADFSSISSFDEIIPLSAKQNDGVDALIGSIRQYLEEGPMFYDSDTVTDQPERAIAAEVIREKMLLLLDKEVPHGTAIEITKMSEKGKIVTIRANIYCEKKSHKGIIIGKNGEMLKKIGTLSRRELEAMLEKKVYLELWIKIKSDWRNSRFMLKSFGYTEDSE